MNAASHKNRQVAVRMEMSGNNQVKVTRIRQALTFSDPQSLMSYIKTASKHPANQNHLLVQALQWVAQQFIGIVQDYNSPDSDSDSSDELVGMLEALAKLWDQGVLDFSESDQSTLPAQPQPEAQPTAPVATTQAQGARAKKTTFSKFGMKVTYGQQKKAAKKISYKELKTRLLMSGIRI